MMRYVNVECCIKRCIQKTKEEKKNQTMRVASRNWKNRRTTQTNKTPLITFHFALVNRLNLFSRIVRLFELPSLFFAFVNSFSNVIFDALQFKVQFMCVQSITDVIQVHDTRRYTYRKTVSSTFCSTDSDGNTFTVLLIQLFNI